MVVIVVGGGGGGGSGGGVVSTLPLFGLCRIFALFTIGLSSQGLRERIAEETYLEHPGTYWGQQILSLDTSGAGAVDSSRLRVSSVKAA